MKSCVNSVKFCMNSVKRLQQLKGLMQLDLYQNVGDRVLLVKKI